MTLQGGNALRNRLAAIAGSFRPMAGNWARDTAKLSASRVRVRSGRLQRSFRVGRVSESKAEVRGHYTAFFVDKGVKPHDIEPKGVSGSGRGGKGSGKVLRFEAGGRTVFARKVHHRGFRGKKFRTKSAREALKTNVGLTQIIQAWNSGGGRTTLDTRAGRGARIRPT